MVQSLDRVKEEKPHGLMVNWDILENVSYPDAERVLRGLAKTGKYDIIWAHSAYSEAVEKMCRDFPDILFAFSGSGNTAIGGNAYWIYMYFKEPPYLLGILAGLMTKTNTIGAVASFPFPSITVPLNSFFSGAKAVNPDIKGVVTYIETWFDPPKAKEATLAQIAAGADFIFAERLGPVAACKEKGVYVFTIHVDQNYLGPEVVLSSTIAKWDPAALYLIDIWWDHVVKGTPYNAPMDKILFDMKDGAGDIAPYHSLASKVPDDIKKKVIQAREDILSGRLVVPLNEEKTTAQSVEKL